MTDARHLDDEVLSAFLDGEVGADAGHLAGCAACSARADQLRGARDAVAAATVPALPSGVLDQLVGAALDAPPEVAPVVPLAGSTDRRRRVLAPPPAWLIGAAAGIAALAGLAGLLRSTGGLDDRGDREAATMQLPAADDEGGDAAGAGGAAGSAVADPEVVTGDLGDLDDPDDLAAAVQAGDTASAFAAGRSAAESEAEEGASADADQDAIVASPSKATAAGDAGAVDRARCRADAERIGAGRLGALLSTSTLRWAGQPAEVLVFALTEPAGGFSRQALVLARPGCALLADPRF